ncbi:transmembrane protein 117-like [Ornithodoros turicata]|uniref:transmembrane protein 117-like n=1 Tax=Ornithodoros turicata TaxID=34597 RepID=UPI003139048E
MCRMERLPVASDNSSESDPDANDCFHPPVSGNKKDSWATATQAAIKCFEARLACSEDGACVSHCCHQKINADGRSPESGCTNLALDVNRTRRGSQSSMGSRLRTVVFTCRENSDLSLRLDDIRYIDESARSSVSAYHLGGDASHSPTHPTPSPTGADTASANPRPILVRMSSSDQRTLDEQHDGLPPHYHLEADTQSNLSYYVEKDFRYFFQHPYSRLFVSYFVIFCNFLVFAEDPISHSRTESEIPIFGNVFSFVCTKYPPEWGWRFLKVLLWLVAIFWGLVCGKYFIHNFLLRNMFRLKMFREEQGTWMIMFMTMLMFVYMFSLVYNTFLMSAHPTPEPYRINAMMGITNANFMKAAACGTWLGDFLTAWMVTDMMLQDDLYPSWARSLRDFWRTHGRTRIIIFWTGTVTLSTVVITLIVSDHISWDYLNREFVATTELSRAFLASFILVMDLLIVMQDWDFPHFVCNLNINLPGLHAASFKYRMFQKYVHLPEIVFHITGKWFNYGIIVIVMMLDLNMWKNQIFYYPPDYGQYIGPDNKVRTVPNYTVLATGNRSLWTYESRWYQINPRTNHSLVEDDILMNSRYLGYPLSVKSMAFIPSIVGFLMFGILTYLYGRFPPKTDETAGGRLRRRKPSFRSSWKRERSRTFSPHRALFHLDVKDPASRLVRPMAKLVVCWDVRCGAVSTHKHHPPSASSARESS